MLASRADSKESTAATWPYAVYPRARRALVRRPVPGRDAAGPIPDRAAPELMS